MAWSVLQSVGTASSGSTSTTIAATYTTNLTSGTKLIAWISWNNVGGSNTINSVQDASANALTQCAYLNDTTHAAGGALYAMDTPAGDVGAKPTITCTFSSAFIASIVILEVSGLVTGNTTGAMLDGTAAIAGFAGASSDALPSYTSTASSEFLFSGQADDGGPQTASPPAGYSTAANSVNNNGNSNAVVAYKNSSNALESGSWTFTGTTTGTVLAIVAFKVTGGAITSGPPLYPEQMTRQPVIVATHAGWRGAQHSR